MKKKTRQLLILNGLLILIVAAAILSVNSGYARIPFSTAVGSIFQPHMDGASVVVAQFRVPRIVLAVLCGMGLALAGCVMQTVTGNPLADPGIAPHMARRLIGGRHHALMPASMLLGALLLLLADTLGRSAFQPREIPVGIVISVLSAPYFLFLLRRYF